MSKRVAGGLVGAAGRIAQGTIRLVSSIACALFTKCLASLNAAGLPPRHGMCGRGRGQASMVQAIDEGPPLAKAYDRCKAVRRGSPEESGAAASAVVSAWAKTVGQQVWDQQKAMGQTNRRASAYRRAGVLATSGGSAMRATQQKKCQIHGPKSG